MAINLAAGLVRYDKRVLLIDADPQANLTSTILSEAPRKTIYDALVDNNHPLPIINVSPNLDLVPASTRMFGLGNRMVSKFVNGDMEGDYRRVLASRLDSVKENYDYVLIDSPPSDGTLFFNVLFAADQVIIVATPEPYSVQGVATFCDIIRAVKSEGHQLFFAGVLINNVETGSRPHREGEAEIRGSMDPKFVFDTSIRHSRNVINAAMNHQSVFAYNPKSIASEDFQAFVLEFLKKTMNYE